MSFDHNHSHRRDTPVASSPNNPDNKAIARRWFEVFNTGSYAIAEEVVTPAHVRHDPAFPELDAGVDGVKSIVAASRANVPDLQFVIEDQIAEGDKVVTRWTARGSDIGTDPCGTVVAVMGVDIARIADGRIVETWADWNALDLLHRHAHNVAPHLAGVPL